MTSKAFWNNTKTVPGRSLGRQSNVIQASQMRKIPAQADVSSDMVQSIPGAHSEGFVRY